MRAFVVELVEEGAELGLPLEEVGAGGPSGFLLQGEVHAFMTAGLLRVARMNALDADAESEPPRGQLGEVE